MSLGWASGGERDLVTTGEMEAQSQEVVCLSLYGVSLWLDRSELSVVVDCPEKIDFISPFPLCRVSLNLLVSCILLKME